MVDRSYSRRRVGSGFDVSSWGCDFSGGRCMNLLLKRICVTSGNLGVGRGLLWGDSLGVSLDLWSIQDASGDDFYRLSKLVYSVGDDGVSQSVDIMRGLGDRHRVWSDSGGYRSDRTSNHCASGQRLVVSVRIVIGGGAAVHLLLRISVKFFLTTQTQY